MHVRNSDMPRIIAPGLTGTALAVILVISTLSPKQVSAQTASPNPADSSAAPAKPVSVLDRIRKKMRDPNTPQDRAKMVRLTGRRQKLGDFQAKTVSEHPRTFQQNR